MVVTIKDVAQLAGVGLGTASRVISGKGFSSADAKARVEAAIRQLDFRPSSIARALALQSTGTIGVYVPVFKGPFYGPMLHAIDKELHHHHRLMLAVAGDGQGDGRQQALDGARALIDRECDGMILTTNALKDADFTELKRRRPQIAVVNRDVKGMKAHCFAVDHRHGGALAAEALLAHGHRRIAVISGPQAVLDNRQRFEGFFERLAAAGIRRERVAVEEGDFTPEGGAAATRALLERAPRLTGLFCANDQMAMAALSCLRSAGKSVPEDVSVIGYDDSEQAAFLSPPLTTVRIAIDDMGLNACRLLLRQCYDINVPVARDFQPQLVMRESLGKAPK